MSVVNETYNRAYNILINKNLKYELTGRFPNDVRLKKISKLHGIITWN